MPIQAPTNFPTELEQLAKSITALFPNAPLTPYGQTLLSEYIQAAYALGWSAHASHAGSHARGKTPSEAQRRASRENGKKNKAKTGQETG